MDVTTPPPGANFVVWLIVLVAIGTVVMVLFKLAVWWGSRVNDYEDGAPFVMSRSDAQPSPSWRPSLETQNQTDRQTEPAPRIRAEELLTLYKVMRSAGIGRDDAAAAFKACGLPFNNNVWRDAEPPAKAAPADDDEIVTPYAGRRTKASYYPEQPELEYQAP